MFRVTDIVEEERVAEYIRERGLLLKYKKAKEKILAGAFTGLDIKKRKPHAGDVWSFRIDKKYRAFFVVSKGVFIVFAIDDHQ